MKKKPDNIIFNYKEKEYDAFKKEYPTSFNSKNFKPEKIKNFNSDTQHYFKTKFNEIKISYESLMNEVEWSLLIGEAKYNFNPIVGRTYYLYQGEKNNFLSLVKPKEWKKKFLGKFKLTTNSSWQKIK